MRRIVLLLMTALAAAPVFAAPPEEPVTIEPPAFAQEVAEIRSCGQAPFGVEVICIYEVKE